ncbi:MAG: hypothetical protein VX737_00295 [Pseudomonadota bacterium]|nr:hypothetical protein [Pseudomonadota bacterium]
MFKSIVSEFIKLIMAIIQATGHAFSSAYTAMANSISAFFTSIHTHFVLPVVNAIHIALTGVFSVVSTVAITLFQTCILPVISFVNQVVSNILYATNIAIHAIASLAFKIGSGVVYAIQYCAHTTWQYLVMPVANAIAFVANVVTNGIIHLANMTLSGLYFVFSSLWQHLVMPVANAIVFVANVVTNGIIHLANMTLSGLSFVFSSLWQHLVMPVANAIAFVVNVVTNGIIHLANMAFTALSNLFSLIWIHILSPVLNAIVSLAQLIANIVYTIASQILSALNGIGQFLSFVAGKIFCVLSKVALLANNYILTPCANALSALAKLCTFNNLINFSVNLLSAIAFPFVAFLFVCITPSLYPLYALYSLQSAVVLYPLTKIFLKPNVDVTPCQTTTEPKDAHNLQKHTWKPSRNSIIIGAAIYSGLFYSGVRISPKILEKTAAKSLAMAATGNA